MSHSSHAESLGTSFPRVFEAGSPEELTRRLARASPEDQARGYLFHATLEQVRLHGSAEAVHRCLVVSGVVEPIPFFKYPFAALLRMIYQAAWELRGPASFEATLYGLGRSGCEHFLRTPVGRSFLVMARRTPQQLVESLPVVYRTGWDHGWVSLQWMGPRRCLATLHQGVIPAPYIEGILQRMFETVGAVRPRVIGRSLSLSETEFDLSWD